MFKHVSNLHFSFHQRGCHIQIQVKHSGNPLKSNRKLFILGLCRCNDQAAFPSPANWRPASEESSRQGWLFKRVYLHLSAKDNNFLIKNGLKFWVVRFFPTPCARKITYWPTVNSQNTAVVTAVQLFARWCSWLWYPARYMHVPVFKA